MGDASTFTATGGLQNNGTLQGSGTVARGGGGTPTVTNAGTVRPGSSPGRLTVSGDYTQTAAGTLVTEVEGSSPGSSLDQLAVSGTATLGGTLDIQNDFSPSPGDSFTILTYGARSGEFATINGLGIDPDHEHLPLYEADRMRLVVTKSAFSDLSIEQSAQATEGDSATHDAEVAVSLSAPTRRTVNVDYATSDGTAGQPGDYTATSGRLTFAPGDEVKKIKVPVRADVLDEGDEQLDVTLSEPGGGTPLNATMPADKTGTLTLVDDDPEPAVSIRDEVFVEEGDTADVTALVPVRLSAPSGRRVTVAYATEAASATAGDDYETTTGTLTFDPGDPTVKTIAVPIRGDTLDEPAEPLTLRLSAPSNASLDPSVADSTIRIVDQDPPRPPSATPSLSVDDVRVAEGNTGENPARLRLQLSESTDQAVTASYSTADVTAQAPTDYDAESGTVTFSPGERTAVVDVPVNGDKTDESDEAFDLNLPNVSSNATLGDSSGRDDEIPPETTITSGPSGTVRSTTASVAFKSSEPEAGSFECRRDGGSWSACASPAGYSALGQGAHTFEVRAIDGEGTVDPTPDKRSWTVDTSAPRVTAVSPSSGARRVAPGANVLATFSEAMQTSTITKATVSLVRKGTTRPVVAKVSYSPTTKRATLDPSASLARGATYTATVTTGAKDLAGNPLAPRKTWSFTVKR